MQTGFKDFFFWRVYTFYSSLYKDVDKSVSPSLTRMLLAPNSNRLCHSCFSCCCCARTTRRPCTVLPGWVTRSWWSCCWTTKPAPTPPPQPATPPFTSPPVRVTCKQSESCWTPMLSRPRWPRWSLPEAERPLPSCCADRTDRHIVSISWLSPPTERLYSTARGFKVWQGWCGGAPAGERGQPQRCREGKAVWDQPHLEIRVSFYKLCWVSGPVLRTVACKHKPGIHCPPSPFLLVL